MDCLVIPSYLLAFSISALFVFRIEPWTLSSNASIRHFNLGSRRVNITCILFDQSQFTPPCKAFLSDPLPCLTILPSDLIVGNSATATGLLPSLPFVVPVPSLVKEEGSAFILSWVQPCKLLPCLWCLRLILGRLWVGLCRSGGHAGFLCLISVGLVSGVAIFLKKFAALLGLYDRHLEP